MNQMSDLTRKAPILAIAALACAPHALAANEITGSCSGGLCSNASASVSVFIAEAVPVRSVQLIGLPSFTFRPGAKLTEVGGQTDQITSYNRGGTKGEQSEFCIQDNYASTVQIQVSSLHVMSASQPSWGASGAFVASAAGVSPGTIPMGVSIRPKGNTDLTATSSQNRWTFDRTGSVDCSSPSDASVVWVDIELLSSPQNNATYSATLAVVATPK